ncbi:glycosyltransferase [Streptomyces sp. AM 2-1-1]|uniref:glycosyltransferase n=1 Tax=Streptomyces sp. AM 2-1-1 TaxID=3028709 RepID=UPI0023B99911|nr:glycosyltransferase [Streptomyces sp. AM 2-1-1]WEH38995.1 glycosyltransferase [Streptomyces sp. AM 2-1-1]
MHIEILAHTLATDSIGARAAARLAESLVTRHRVTVVAARGAAAPHPALRLPGNVEVIALAPSVGAGDRDDDDTSQLVIAGDPEFRRYNRADDGRLRKHLSASGADAVVALSSALGAVLAQCRVPHARRVARQPAPVERLPESVRARWTELYRELDAVVPLTEGDAAAPEYRALRDAGVEVRHIAEPVVLAESARKPSTGAVISAGRLVSHRRVDLALHAFAQTRAAQPGWQLRVFGTGPLRRETRDLVTALQLHDHVLLFDREAGEDDFYDADIALVTAERLDSARPVLEAFAQATPVVATDAPYGAPEVLTDGQSGLLVPVGDVQATAHALERYMADEQLREAHRTQALRTARSAGTDRVGEAYEELFTSLKAGAARGRWGQRRRTGGGAPAADRVLPTADCRVLPNGEWELTLRGVSGARTVRVEEQGKGGGQTVGFPVEGDGRARIDARALAVLGEGRADLYVVDGRGRSSRLRYGRCTVGGARDVGHLSDLDRFHWVLPYASEGGYLRLRVWSRPSHAELVTVDYGDTSLWLTGWLQGRWRPGGEPSLLLRRRQEPARTLTAGRVRFEDGWFGAELNMGAAMRSRLLMRENWDVLLTDGSGAEPVRVARIADDQVVRRDVQRFPELVREEPTDLFGPDVGRAVVGLRPYFTADNELSLVVTEHH